MKYGYLIAYTDRADEGFTEKEPWIHPSHPMNKKDIIREFKFITDVVKASHATIFKVEKDNIPEVIDWEFVEENKIEK